MCGQVGFILGKRKRTKNDLMKITRSFLYLMLYSESQGPHATGVAMVQKDGDYKLYKRPGRAHRHINTDGFLNTLAPLNSDTTLLMGHTRYKTRGSAKKNRNNHPLRAGVVLGTHNGTIFNADELFQKLSLPRQTDVDSEYLVRLADRCVWDGLIDVPDLLKGISFAKGLISSVLISFEDPERILVLKGNKPLTIWVNKRRLLIAYASQESWLERALEGQWGWKSVDMKPMTLSEFHTDKILEPCEFPLEFTEMAQNAELLEEV